MFAYPRESSPSIGCLVITRTLTFCTLYNLAFTLAYYENGICDTAVTYRHAYEKLTTTDKMAVDKIEDLYLYINEHFLYGCAIPVKCDSWTHVRFCNVVRCVTGDNFLIFSQTCKCNCNRLPTTLFVIIVLTCGTCGWRNEKKCIHIHSQRFHVQHMRYSQHMPNIEIFNVNRT